MKLMRFKDDTYTWIDGDTRSGILNKNEAIAYGVWQVKAPKDEVLLGIETLVANGVAQNKENVAIFGNINKLFLYVSKIDDYNHSCFEEQAGDSLIQ